MKGISKEIYYRIKQVSALEESVQRRKVTYEFQGVSRKPEVIIAIFIF